MIELDGGIIAKLESYRGTLAYLAVMMRGEGTWPTAHLAAAVHCQTAVMREGLEELSRLHPEIVLGKSGKWKVGSGVATEEAVQILESEAGRRKDFIDDIKKYWDYKNPDIPFRMGQADGRRIAAFLKEHNELSQDLWRQALRNRAKSEVNHAQPIFAWIGRLDEYIPWPLDRYGKPMLNGGGKVGEAITTEQRNREARAAAVAGVPAGR